MHVIKSFNLSIFPVVLFFSLISSPDIFSMDEECDFKCQISSKNKEKKKSIEPESNKIENKKKSNSSYLNSFASANSSNLFVTNTASYNAKVAKFIGWLNANLDDLIYIPYGFEYTAGYASGSKNNVRISDESFYLIDKENNKKYKILTIDSSSTSGSQGIYGINNLEVADTLIKEFKFDIKGAFAPSKLSQSVKGITFNLNAFEEIAGDKLEWYLDPEVAQYVRPLFKNIDITFEQEISKPSDTRMFNSFAIDLNDTIAIYIDAEASQPVELMDKLWKEISELMYKMVDRETLLDLARTEYIPSFEQYVDVYNQVENAIYSGDYEADFQRLGNYFSDPQILSDLSGTLYGFSLGLNWSDELFRNISRDSGGAIDGAMLMARGMISNKMSKYEIQMLLQSAGIDRNLQGLYLDYVYSLYEQLYDQAKIFINNPRGLLIELKFPNGLDQEIFYELEQNPMLAFTILNSMELKITANPRF